MGESEEICVYLFGVDGNTRSIAWKGKSRKGQCMPFKLVKTQHWTFDTGDFPECFLCCERGLWTCYKSLGDLHRGNSFSFTLRLQLYFCFLWLTAILSNMFFTTVAFAVLCLVSGSLAAPLTCDDVVRPEMQPDLPLWYGLWTLVATSTKVVYSFLGLVNNDSFTLHYNNATFLVTQRTRDHCSSTQYNVTLEGAHFNNSVGYVTVSGTIFANSCPDCILARFITQSSYFHLEHLCLLSRRREVNPEELQEFKTLVSCLKFPDYIVMDPSKELCPPPEGFYSSN